jgi:hypothetical protein
MKSSSMLVSYLNHLNEFPGYDNAGALSAVGPQSVAFSQCKSANIGGCGASTFVRLPDRPQLRQVRPGNDSAADGSLAPHAAYGFARSCKGRSVRQRLRAVNVE